MWWERLRGLLQPAGHALLARQPTAEDFTPRAVQQAILKDTLQHPATILPGALAAVAALWSLAIELSPASLLAMLGFGFVSATAWVINYVGRGDTLAAQHIQTLQTLRVEYERREVETLALHCQRAGFHDGAKEARELTAAYQKLNSVLLEPQRGGESASDERFRVLAEDTYRHGVFILHQALSLFQALHRIEVDTLEQERQAWLRQQQHAPSVSLERNIDAHSKRLERYHKRAEELHELMAQINELETALETAYLEIVDLSGRPTSPILFDSGTAARLQTAVAAARRVEQRLRGLDHGDTPADDEYRKAGEQGNT